MLASATALISVRSYYEYDIYTYQIT